MNDTRQTISRRKLSDEVLDRLLQMIERREVEPGGFLPSERELMVQFGVGRPAVREAMQALAGMGLIQIQHGERARLISLDARGVLERVDRSVRYLLQSSPETRDHLREARLLFETGMVRLAARSATGKQVVELRAAIQRQTDARGDPPKFMAADMAFHKAIASIPGNPIYAAVSEAMLQWVFENFPRLLRAPGTERLTLREHETIVAKIEARDEEGAVRAMTDHLRRTNPLYRKNA